jgi:hypothetical protein
MRKEPFKFKNSKGIEYEVLFRKPNERHYGDADGTCANPGVPNPKIHISPYLTLQSELNTCIHEFAHAYFWDKTETEISAFANSLSRFLYTERKWRRMKRQNKKRKK